MRNVQTTKDGGIFTSIYIQADLFVVIRPLPNEKEKKIIKRIRFNRKSIQVYFKNFFSKCHPQLVKRHDGYKTDINEDIKGAVLCILR